MPDGPHVGAGELLTERWPKPLEQDGRFPAESGGQNPWNRVAKTRGIRTSVRPDLLSDAEPSKSSLPFRDLAFLTTAARPVQECPSDMLVSVRLAGEHGGIAAGRA